MLMKLALNTVVVASGLFVLLSVVSIGQQVAVRLTCF